MKIGVFFGKILNKTPLPQKMGLYFVHEKRHFVHKNCQFVQMAQNRLEISVFDSNFDLKFKENLVINNLKISSHETVKISSNPKIGERADSIGYRDNNTQRNPRRLELCNTDRTARRAHSCRETPHSWPQKHRNQ